MIPYGIIWTFTGWVFLTVEYLATDGKNVKPDSDITLDIGILVFASIGTMLVGVLVGFMESFVLQKPFRKLSFTSKIFIKTIIYLALMMIVILITYPIAASLEFNVHIFDPQVWNKWFIFLNSTTFLSTLIQMFFSILLCTIYAGVSENIGFTVFINLLTGKYHRPIQEERIFMFLDMKHSTSHAEKLGHVKYFDLLGSYYNDLSNSIINHLGEVYQYVGDEIVITWTLDKGISRNNCLDCFFSMKKTLEKKSEWYINKYGIVPEFKAGIHLGEVTTGEIGALKKEIFYTGDVLNVSSRIQSLCKEYGKDLLISSKLKSSLILDDSFKTKSIGEVHLKGRDRSIEIISVEK